jgi:drug/metabolite transporter (DMT)-like permease
MERNRLQPQGGLDPLRGSSENRGILLLIASTFLIASMDTLVKLASAELSTIQIAWGRYSTQAVLLCALSAPTFLRSLQTRRPWLHLFRAGLLITGNTSFMAALRFMPLAEANVIGFAAPLFLTGLSRPVLGERVGWIRWFAVVLGFGGVLIVVGAGSDFLKWAALLPLLMAACSAAYNVLTPVVARTEDPIATLYFAGVIGAAAFSLAVPFFWTAPSNSGWSLLILLGILGTAGHFGLIRAFELAPVATLSPLLYVYLVWAVGFGWFVFGEVPAASTVIGAIVVITCGLIVYIGVTNRDGRNHLPGQAGRSNRHR